MVEVCVRHTPVTRFLDLSRDGRDWHPLRGRGRDSHRRNGIRESIAVQNCLGFIATPLSNGVVAYPCSFFLLASRAFVAAQIQLRRRSRSTSW
jgi:hypothetical protein